MNGAFSPEEVITLGEALEQLAEKYGSLSEAEKQAIAARLLRLAEDGIFDIDRLVEIAGPDRAP